MSVVGSAALAETARPKGEAGDHDAEAARRSGRPSRRQDQQDYGARERDGEQDGEQRAHVRVTTPTARITTPASRPVR
jgi:hypothetical protein